jgi:phosphoglycerol transferase MdoB-like AlkP superfamily enzyme
VSSTRRGRLAERGDSQDGAGAVGEDEDDVTAVVALLLLVVMFVIGSRVHGVRSSPWKLLAFVVACLVVLALLFLILAK